MGEARPSLLSHCFVALFTGALLLLTAEMFAAPFRRFRPDLLMHFAAARSLTVPWEPLLTREELLRGLAYYGTGARLHAVAAKLLAGQPIKVALLGRLAASGHTGIHWQAVRGCNRHQAGSAFASCTDFHASQLLQVYTLGGSITRGGGAKKAELSYARRFFSAINASFPHSGHVFENKAISAATSFLFAPCMSYHVPDGADLVVLEFTMNDPYDGAMTAAARRSYETVVRQLLARPDGPAILQLHAWSWWRPGKSRSPPDGVDHGLFYWPQGESDLTLLAHYYNFPSVSVRSATFRLQYLGINRFKVDKVASAGWVDKSQLGHYFVNPNGTIVVGLLCDARADQNDQYFYSDDLHPHATGHGAIAELLLHPLSRALEEVQLGKALSAADRRGDPRLDTLPPPMIPHSHDERASVCAMLEDFKGVVVATNGFEYLPERLNAKEFADQKWGWSGTQPGAWAEVVVDTRSKTYQGDALVWLSHLRSHQGMGIARVECKEGCTCQPTELDGRATPDWPVSVFWVHKLFASQHERCRLRVTITEQPAGHDGGHKVTLIAIMVTHIDNMTKAGTLVNVNWINPNGKVD